MPARMQKKPYIDFDAAFIPPAPESLITRVGYQHERELELDYLFRRAAKDDQQGENYEAAMRAAFQETEEILGGFAERRINEDQVADYIERASEECDPADLFMLRKAGGIVDKLRDCRRSGVAMERRGGDPVFMFEKKCGQCKLCADEAREETRRLCQKYLPPVQNYARENGHRYVYYAVFTIPNIASGSLREGKRDLCANFNAWQREHFAGRIDGSLIVQEDPLSAHGDWNVHLNAILLSNTRLDYKEIRETWGYNVEIKKLSSDTMSLTRSFLEIMKYCVKTVPSKSDGHLKDGKSVAPAMVLWEYRHFMEWWSANKRFRRVRSYGNLYKVKKPEDDELDVRAELDAGRMRVVGKFEYECGAYELDSIQDDNFFLNNEERYLQHEFVDQFNRRGNKKCQT